MDTSITRKSIYACGGRTAYWELNPELPDVLIILHGFRGTHRALIPISRHFDTYRVILPDRPGHGESDRLDKPHTLANYARWLDEIVDKLGLTRFAVLGHSHGATIAFIHAAQGTRKPSAVVGVSVPPSTAGVLQWLSTCYYQLGRIMPTALRRPWLTNYLMDYATARMLFKHTRGQELSGLLSESTLDLASVEPEVVLDEYFSAIHTDLGPYVSAISAPILFITGARDIIAPLGQVRSLAAKAQRGTLRIMADQGHMAPIEAPGATAGLSERFLNSIVDRQ